MGWSEDYNDNIIDESCYLGGAYDKYIANYYFFSGHEIVLLRGVSISA